MKKAKSNVAPRSKIRPAERYSSRSKAGRSVARIARRILAYADGRSRLVAAKELGILKSDLANLRSENMPGLVVMLRLIQRGRFSPEALFLHDRLEKLAPGVRTNKVSAAQISARIRKICKDHDPEALAKATGLKQDTIYHLRVKNRAIGFRAVAAFISAGVPVNHVFFGEA